MSLSLKNIIKGALPHALCEYSIRRHDYLRLGFPTTGASWKALSTRQHEAMCAARLNLLPPSIISNLGTCVDAGANLGHWTLALLEGFKPQRVLALECDTRMVTQLKTTMAPHPQVQVVDAALAADDGEAQFYQLRHPAGSSLLKPRPETAREFEAGSWDVVAETTVRKISYDELVAPEVCISILKLDVQGAEKEVLIGSGEGLRKTISIITEVNFMQHYDGDAVFAELHEVMRLKGFGLYRLSPPYHRGGRALYADAVYVREEILASLIISR